MTNKGQNGYIAKACEHCGKLCFTTRKAARRHYKSYRQGQTFSVYECNGYFHFGHAPYLIRRGAAARADYRN